MRTVRRIEAGGGLVLREFLDSDVEDLLAVFAEPDVAAWNPSGAADQGVDGVRSWIAARNDWTTGDHRSWGVERGGRLVGSVSLHHLDLAQANAESGYWVAPWARRRGVATAALRAAAHHGFTTLGLVRVFCYHAVENVGSCGVATAAGLVLEGTLRQSFRYGDGRHHDEHLHARLATD